MRASTINIFIMSAPPKKDDENKKMLKQMLQKKDDLAGSIEKSMSSISRMISHGTSHLGAG
jgi:hypothetical protein